VTTDHKFRCPNCGGLDVRHSKRQGPLDAVMNMFNRSPFRCRACAKRFYAVHREVEENDETAEEATDQA